MLDAKHTCDGASISPPFSWSGVPAGTKSIALTIHHITPDDTERIYLVRYGIPADATSLAEGDATVGKFGLNNVGRRAEYAPPCSQGPGEKTYIVTIYALSAEPKLATATPTREELLAAIKDITLKTGSLELRYARPEGATGAAGGERRPREGQGGAEGGGQGGVQGGGQGGSQGGGRRGQRGGQRGGEGGGAAAAEAEPAQPSDAPPTEGRGGGRGQGGGQGGGGQGGGGQGGSEARGGGQGGGGQAGGLLERMTAFKTDVPTTDHEAILARPTATTMTVSVRASSDRLGAIEFARDGDARREITPKIAMKAGVPTNFTLVGLAANTAYTYRFVYWAKEGDEPKRGEECRFQMPRATGSPYAFVIQADSHLDQGVTPKVYEQTLANMVAAKPDFLVDLGDTFMTDKRGQDYERSEPQYDAQRYYFSLACRTMPLFMVLGNHDGEKGDVSRGIAEWSYNERTSRFPEPVIDGTMYTGATTMKDGRGANYYAFEWGDALVVVLDPFWSTTERSRGGGGGGGGGRGAEGGGGGGGAGGGPNVEKLAPTDSSWSRTLGRAQYDWLAETLAKSKAKQKFVFIHHLVGGIGGQAARGGVESARYFEWGGDNADGSEGFAQRRAGWAMPIHDLLVKHGVTAVFHGHDHLYVHSTLDGIHYQCVPQPGNLAGNTRSAEEYGYASGTLHGSPGHLRVSMAANGDAKVEFVRTAISEADATAAAGGGGRNRRGAQTDPNGTVIDSYEIKPRTAANANTNAKE
ncbi:MAG: metallophosphoesterase [Planctomycetaceae bacterium]|nr:metallophosphoesterase [Planctomycetaceae bacterium]